MEPDKRQAVLAALRQFGGDLSQRQAAVKFGVPSPTIAAWAKERNDGKVVKLATVPPPPESREDHATAAGRGIVKARVRLAGIVSEALGEQIRGDLRGSVGNLASIIRSETARALAGPPAEVDPDEWKGPSMRDVADAARALDALLARAGDILAFDGQTQAPGEVRKGADLLDAAAVSRQFRERNRRQA